MGFAIRIFRWNPCFYIVLLYLPQSKVCSAIDDHAMRKIECLEQLLGILRKLLMELYGHFVARLAKHYLLKFEKFVHANKSLRVFAVTSRFAAETGRKS